MRDVYILYLRRLCKIITGFMGGSLVAYKEEYSYININ